jgi:ubiquinone biosynthesis protein COQ4
MNEETPPRRKRDWPRAFRALRKLIAEPQSTVQAFEVIEGLAGSSFEDQFDRFAADPGGRRLLAEKPSLLAALSDRAALAAMPAGSFGRTYHEIMERGRLTAGGLVEADDAAALNEPDRPPVGEDREYLGDRVRDMHDLWHVLTGYGMDEAGEAANLAFSAGQIPNLGMSLIVAAAALVGPKDLRLTWPRYLLAAWRRGRRSSFLSAAPYEELLPLPLEDVRERLGIPPAAVAHPNGIAVASVMSGEPSIAWQTA